MVQKIFHANCYSRKTTSIEEGICEEEVAECGYMSNPPGIQYVTINTHRVESRIVLRGSTPLRYYHYFPPSPASILPAGHKHPAPSSKPSHTKYINQTKLYLLFMGIFSQLLKEPETYTSWPP